MTPYLLQHPADVQAKLTSVLFIDFVYSSRHSVNVVIIQFFAALIKDLITSRSSLFIFILPVN